VSLFRGYKIGSFLAADLPFLGSYPATPLLVYKALGKREAVAEARKHGEKNHLKTGSKL
jgi:hypothetical protein